MMVTAVTNEDVTGGGVAFLGGNGLTGKAAAAAAGPGRAGVVGVDGYTAGHFTGGGYNWFGGDFGFAIGRIWF